MLTDPPVAEPVPPNPETDPANPDAPKEGDKPPEEVKPVEYTDFTLPEGLTPEDPTLAMFREEAGKLGLNQEQAQALVTKIGAQAAITAQARWDGWVKQNTDWQAEVAADPEIGGPHFEDTKINIGRFLDDYCGPIGSPERARFAQEALLTGAGNLPSLVKVMARAAAALTEGGHVSGNPAKTRLSDAEIMYPTHSQPPRG